MGSRTYIFPAFTFIAAGCVLFTHLSAVGHAQATESPELRLARQHYFSGRYTAAADVTAPLTATGPEALAAYESLIPDAERAIPTHWALGAFRLGKGQCLADMERREEAEPLLVGAAESLEKNLGKNHPYSAKAREAVAANYEAWGKPDLAAKFK